MPLDVNRRGLITGLAGFVACAPAVVRASSMMAIPRRDKTFLRWWQTDMAVDWANCVVVVWGHDEYGGFVCEKIGCDPATFSDVVSAFRPTCARTSWQAPGLERSWDVPLREYADARFN